MLIRIMQLETMNIKTMLQKYGYDETTGKEEIQDWKDF